LLRLLSLWLGDLLRGFLLFNNNSLSTLGRGRLLLRFWLLRVRFDWLLFFLNFLNDNFGLRVFGLGCLFFFLLLLFLHRGGFFLRLFLGDSDDLRLGLG